MNPKICMFTTLNHEHMRLFVAFIKSFLHHNPWFDYDFVILDIGLTELDKGLIKKYYDKVMFKEPRKENYENVNYSKTRDRLRLTYFKLDAFCQTEYDRLIAIDMDMIVLADLKEVFDCVAGFAACHAYDQNHDCMMETINSGLFVINFNRLEPDVYEGVLNLARRGHSMPDQQTLILYFKNRTHILNKTYNVEKRIYKSQTLKHIVKNVKVWHFISDKPYEHHCVEKERGFNEIENIWWSWYNK